MLHSGVRRRLGTAGHAVVMIALALMAGPAGAVEPANAVAVLPLEIEGNVPAGRLALESAVVRGLAVLSGPTIGATEAAAKLEAAGAKLPCTTEACWTTAGKAIDARYLVAGRVERKGPLFEVNFRLLDAPSGRLLSTENNKCEVSDCSVAELCRTTVRELVRQTLGEPGAGAVGAGPGGPAPPSSGATGPAFDDSRGSTQQLEQQAGGEIRARRIPLVLPIAAIGAGVAALAVGGFYLAREGDCTDSMRPCQRHHRTLWGGIGWAAGGTALVTTGIVLAVMRSQSAAAGGDAGSGPSLSIGPGSLLVSGRF